MKTTAEDPIEKKIVAEICDYLHLDYYAVMEKNRSRVTVRARMYAMFFIVELGYTITAVAKMFGKDHTTVLHLLSKLKTDIDKDRIVRNQFFELRDRISCLIDPKGLKSEFEELSEDLDYEAEMILNYQSIYR